MISITFRRTVLSNLNGCNRYFATLPGSSFFNQKRCVHQTRPAAESVADSETIVLQKEKENDLVKRFKVTGEVLVSKIFPAGFGWQSASLVAEQMNYAPESLKFALTTGLGDAIGVIIGHCTFYGIKKAITGNEKILMKREFDTGFLLASAAFCSGTVWQPVVNFLQGAGLSFNSVFTGTFVGCGMAFYVGLRAARTIYPSFLDYVEEPTYENSKTDALLSVSIGSATGFFVGTDVAYLPEQNFLINVVGIQDSASNLAGCALAGTSTTLGFGAFQSGMNVIVPKTKNWND